MKKITESILGACSLTRMKKAAHEAAALKDVFIHLFDGCFFKP